MYKSEACVHSLCVRYMATKSQVLFSFFSLYNHFSLQNSRQLAMDSYVKFHLSSKQHFCAMYVIRIVSDAKFVTHLATWVTAHTSQTLHLKRALELRN